MAKSLIQRGKHEDQEAAKRAFLALAGDAAAGDPFAWAGRAARTWRQYVSAWSLFREWCEERDVPSLPASTATVREWIVDLIGRGCTVGTAQSYLAAVSVAHRLAGHTVDRQSLLETLRGARRLARRPRQAEPLTADTLKRIVAMLDKTRPADVRDGALLTIGWAGVLRQSELVGLDLDRIGPDSTGRGFLTVRKAGLEIVLEVSKASQATTERVPIPADEMPAAIEWFNTWRTTVGLTAGSPLFRPIDQAGRISDERLAGPSVGAILRKRVYELGIAEGLTPEDAWHRTLEVRGHSLRSGWMSHAAACGLTEHEIRLRSRHRSMNVAAGYVRAAMSWQRSGLGRTGF